MKANTTFYIYIILISFILQACNLLGTVSTPDTELDPVLAAQMTITAAGLNQQLSSTATYTVIPVLSPMSAYTLTPVLTGTPAFAYVTLSEVTNCRTGADVTFELVDTFQVGQTIQVMGKHSFDNYWYVRSPNNPNINCWMWGLYATGANLDNVPALTPPATYTPVSTATSTSTPTPTSAPLVTADTHPVFVPTYVNYGKCFNWWSRIKLQNVGTVTVRSMAISVKDTITGEFQEMGSNGFQDINACATSTVIPELAMGNTATIYTPLLSGDPTGHKISATITLCTENGLRGTCSSSVLEYTP